MKSRFLIFALALTLVALACSFSAPATAPTTQADVKIIVSETTQALTQLAPTPSSPAATTPSGIAVSFQNVRFVIPNGLALGAAGEAIPEVTATSDAPPWDVAPAHIRFTFNGYNNALAKFSEAHIKIFPTQGYSNSWAGNSVSRLQTILASPAAPIDAKELPGVPYFNAGQLMAAQVGRINFASGSGVRMVTQYGQAVGQVNNNGTFYHFQGLTSDGKFYVIAVVPIGAPFLASDMTPNAQLPDGGVPFPDNASLDPKDFENYFNAVAEKMNATDPNAFSPALPTLDALIASIQILNP